MNPLSAAVAVTISGIELAVQLGAQNMEEVLDNFSILENAITALEVLLFVVGLLTVAFGLTRRERTPRIRYPEERLYIG